jgi:UDP-GlcNAc:undecaprenyl-phosphate/decaprenyl-phosphate GlcNAc-1-phosphate transferase
VRQTLLLYLPLVAVTFLTALIAVAAFVPQVRAFAERVGAVQEGGGRRVHQGRIPNIGGIAILGGFLLALLLGSLVRPALLDEFRVELLAIVLGGVLMTLVGFLDDLWDIPPGTRLLTQFVAAGILVVNGVKIDYVTNYFGSLSLFADANYVYLSGIAEVLAVALTLLWIVGFTNAFNFIDGLDGLSSGMVIISSLCLLAVALQFPDRGAAVLLLAALAGAGLGFLRHNYAPATIYMGDSGA